MSALSHAPLFSCVAVTGCDRLPLTRVCPQVQCERCQHWMPKAQASGHRLCLSCRHPPTAAAAAAPAGTAHSLHPSLFGRLKSCIDQLTLVERAAIVTLHVVGWAGAEIAAALRCSDNAVSRWVQRWRDVHSLSDAERSGRPRLTTPAQDDSIVDYSSAHVTAVPRDIVSALELPVSARTVRRRLNEAELYSCVQRAEHDNARARLAWAEGYSHWTAGEAGGHDWSRVLFSDETHFYLGTPVRAYVQRPRGAALDPKYTRKEVGLPSGKVSLWGCISAGGLGHAELYAESLNAARYQRILKLNLAPSALDVCPRGQWWYQQDNWTVHTAATTREWFDREGVDVIDWPAWSPDLNPIEELWHDLKQRVYARHPRTTEQLEALIKEEWDNTDLEFIRHICLSMPRRLQLVIANGGHRIPY
jgi:transposase